MKGDKTMNNQRGIWVLAGALFLGASGVAHAQETLGGVAAAGAIGATMGAAGAGALSASHVTRNVNNGSNTGAPDEPDLTQPPSNSAPRGSLMPGGSSSRAGAPSASSSASHPAAAQIYEGTGADFVSELMSSRGPSLRSASRVRRSPRAQARYAARVSRMGRAARTRRVLGKYRIPPRGWLAAYLPQDRYKFGKVWRYVSTESDRFYYSPPEMARRRFNPNRVIGFNSYQDALAAGYRPDPISKPAPGAQIASIARLYRGPELNDFVEYVYSGQIAPDSLDGVYNYAMTVDRTLRPTRARPYIGSTVAKILEAALTGDSSIIPRSFDANGPIVAVPVNTNNPRAGGMAVSQTTTTSSSSTTTTTGGTTGNTFGGGVSGDDRRTEDFNNFGNRAGKLANVPANGG